MEDDNTIEDTMVIARELEETGVACFNIAAAWHEFLEHHPLSVPVYAESLRNSRSYTNPIP
ncbi:MAG: hypothetical protein ACTSUQ_00370 [Candidatus Freyarchaeota archaeon]